MDTLWSWSRYHCYKQDTYEYFLKYVLHEPEDRTNSIYCVSGGNVHEIIEQLYTDQIKYEDMRVTLDTQCPHCKTWQHFKAIVKNGVLEKLETTKVFDINDKFKRFNEM